MIAAVKLLFDENLSPRLVALLSPLYPNSSHVDLVGFHGKTDREVWDYARQNGYALVSKDNDFRQLSFVLGAPPKVVFLSVGNAGTDAIAALLRERRTALAGFWADAETALLVIEFEERP